MVLQRGYNKTIIIIIIIPLFIEGIKIIKFVKVLRLWSLPPVDD